MEFTRLGAIHSNKPMVKRTVWPCCLPAPVLHSQSHLLKVPGVSVQKGWIHSFISIRARLRLTGCMTQTSSCEAREGFRFRQFKENINEYLYLSDL